MIGEEERRRRAWRGDGEEVSIGGVKWIVEGRRGSVIGMADVWCRWR